MAKLSRLCLKPRKFRPSNGISKYCGSSILWTLQIIRYQDERKELISRQEQDIPATIKQTRQLQRENAEVSLMSLIIFIIVL